MSNPNDIFDAIYNNDIDRVEFLITSSPDYINVRNEEGQTPLILAAIEGKEDVLLFLIESGSNINEIDYDEDTALMNVARNGFRENIIEILLNRGADINLQNIHGYSAFMLAVIFNPSNTINTLQTLLNAGADIELRDSEGNTSLQLAVRFEKEDLIMFLIENGEADINSQNNVGDTPLITATYSGFILIVQTLLTQGANINLQNHHMQTPLHVALEYERALIANYLCGNINLEIDIRDIEGKTPLMYACEWGFLEIVVILLGRGGNPYAVDIDNHDSFYFANLNGNLEIIQSLLEFRDLEINIDEEEQEAEEEEEEEYSFAAVSFDEEDFDFEEAADIDERNFTFNTCKDLILDENVNIVEHLNETDTFLFINGNPSEIGASILCYDKNTIRQFLENKNDNWFYECDGPFLTLRDTITGEVVRDTITGEEIITNDRSMSSIVNFPYIKMFLNEEGLTGFLPLTQIRKLLSSNHKVYYIYPMIENGSQKMISHTVSWKLAYGFPTNQDFWGANHCQEGTNILIYTLKVCRDPERCVRSVINASPTTSSASTDERMRHLISGLGLE